MISQRRNANTLAGRVTSMSQPIALHGNHTHGIKQLAIIFAINDARVDRAFINLAAVGAGDDTTRHH